MTIALSADDLEVRGALTRAIAELGYAPSNDALATRVGCDLPTLENHLRRLHATHSLLLHPGTAVPWVVHPFALAPGSCWVETPRHGYWANCLYCAFGIAAAVDSDAVITTRYGGESETVQYAVRRGLGAEESADIFHLSTPPARWWDNVVFACSTFQPFRSDADVERWCERHALPRGATMSVAALWNFASSWYGNYLAQPWHKRTPAEANALFARHGLTGEFWDLS
ncbi:MAG TPA: organomercurial lyase [Gemmatimonadaceae bacterium]|nr:organomercurial lyase [Gemmatimonadaceae bacterium]